MLEDGDEVTARAELVAYVRASDNSLTGRSLLKQIDTPPEEFFPAEFREVILRKDQSLSNIAKTYLGSALQFHALAKYNGIKQPGRMFPGQIVKVPLTDAAKDAFEELEDALDEPSLDSQPLVESLNSEAREALDSLELQSSTLQEDKSIEAQNEITSQIETAKDIADDSGNVVKIAEPATPPKEVQETVSTLPVTEPAATEISVDPAPPPEAPAVDVDALHRRAINAYRAQDLDTAISIWNRVLEVDPSYEGARLYRSQALALRKRLNSFN